MPSKPLPVFGRYLLFQLPGIGIATLVLVGLVEIWDLPVNAAVVLFALWVAKDLALYPFLNAKLESRFLLARTDQRVTVVTTNDVAMADIDHAMQQWQVGFQ